MLLHTVLDDEIPEYFPPGPTYRNGAAYLGENV